MMLFNPQKNYLVSFIDDNDAFITCLNNLYMYQDRDGMVISEAPQFKTYFTGELGTLKMVHLNTNYLDISDEEIINLIKE